MLILEHAITVSPILLLRHYNEHLAHERGEPDDDDVPDGGGADRYFGGGGVGGWGQEGYQESDGRQEAPRGQSQVMV